MSQVRLVGENFNSIVSATEAWNQAEKQGLDLVLVSTEDAVPPVVKIEDFKKILFEKKKARASQKSQTKKRKVDLKEVQFKANISDHDLQTKVNSINKFLERGDKVKITVRLKGRERENPERADEIISKVHGLVTQTCRFTKVPGPIAMALLEPGAAK